MLTIPGVISVVWRVTLLVAACALPALMMRRRSASVQHLLWSAALAGALAVPPLIQVLPKWTIPVWEDLLPAQGTVLFEADARADVSSAPEHTLAMVSRTETPKPKATPGEIPWASGVWCLGALIVCFQTLLGAVVVVRLRRRSVAAPNEVAALTGELAQKLGLRQRIRVLQVAGASTPMTWGLFRPVILLPESVLRDNDDRIRAILIHELAHVARQDFVLHLIAQAACAVYWFHPLVWLVRREALHTRERACDDIVLGFGVRPSDYASSLVQLSRALAMPHLCSSLGMCRSSKLEARVRAILDARLSRNRLTAAGAFAAIAATLVLVIGIVVAEPALARVPLLSAPPLIGVTPPSLAPATQPSSGLDLAAMETQAQQAEAAFNLEEAARLYRQVADLKRQMFGAGSAQYSSDLIRLGALYRSWDRLEEAQPFYAEALSILEGTFGPNYPGLAAPLYFMALQAHLKEDLSGAEVLYKRVLDLWAQPAGPETALARRALAVIARQRGGPANEELPGIAAVTMVLPPGGEMPPFAGSEPPLRVGGDVSAPRVLSKVEPQYSREARLAKFQGTVLLRIVIESDGLVREIRVARPLGLGLDQKAVEALRQWKFQPGMKDGVPVRVAAQVEINFRLM